MDNVITLTPTSKYKEMGWKFPELNPFQSKFEQEYDHTGNAVVSAPTGSGKTLVAELCALKALSDGKRFIFLAPMKSLCREKYEDWSNEDHPFSEYGVAILTGDFTLTPAKKKELALSKTILMTSEMLDSRSRRMSSEGNLWLMETDVLVVDESHIIGMWEKNQQPLEARGHKLEAALMRFSKLNPKCRIVLLSATLPNLPHIGEWLTKLNGKETKIIVSDYRPQPLVWHLNTYPEQMGYGGYHTNKSRMFDKACEIITSHKDDMFLIFCHSKTDGRAFQKRISAEIGTEVPFHSADLDKDERINIENEFKGRKNPYVIATSTLAYGVNLPARRVIILDLNRGLNEVHPYDIKQMGGRAGRPGLDPCGDVHWIVGDRQVMKAQKTIDTMPEAKSLMFDVDVFAFHVVAEIAEGGIENKKGIVEFYERCLAHHQGAKVDDAWLFGLLNKLIEVKAIQYVSDYRGNPTEELCVTPLGRIASWLYFSPFDIWHWTSNLEKLIASGRKDDAAFAWSWTAIRSNAMTYVPKDCLDLVERYQRAVGNGNNLGDIRGCEVAGAAIWLKMQGKEKEVPPSALPLMRNISYDVNRHLQALKLIDSMYIKAGKQDGLKTLSVRIQYGVGWACAKLCLLPGIGAVRGNLLIQNGIKSLEDLIEKSKVGIQLLGPKIYENATADQNEESEDD